MIHDPLCPDTNSCECYKDGSGIHSCRWSPCQCELISTVRSNISYKIIQYANDTHIPHSPYTACQRCDIVAAYNHAAEIAKGK